MSFAESGRIMSKISETLARSKDAPICFTGDEEVREFLIEFGIAGQVKEEETNQGVKFVACLNHPTHYLLAMHNWDRVNPQESGFMLTCIPKSTETVERFLESCNKTVKVAEETFRKFFPPAGGR